MACRRDQHPKRNKNRLPAVGPKRNPDWHQLGTLIGNNLGQPSKGYTQGACQFDDIYEKSDTCMAKYWFSKTHIQNADIARDMFLWDAQNAAPERIRI